MEAEPIGHCHWKSNAFLGRSARAENDLDLLVRRADAPAFGAILHRLCFKEARDPTSDVPGVLDYYGYDSQVDRLVHVHAHYQLIVGDDTTKSYRLPLEAAFLAAATPQGVFRVPPPELELIVFVIRMILKHSTWDAVLTRQGQLPAAARQEFEYLRAASDQDLLLRLLQEYLPVVDKALFEDCVRALAPGCGMWTRLKTGHRLLARLGTHARHSRAVDISLKVWRRGASFLRRRFSRASVRRRQLVSGGAMIAVVGGDGAGKSTAVQELHSWLSRDLAVRKVHLGKPPWSWTTFVIRAAIKASLLFTPGRKDFPRALRLLLDLAIARDRCSTHASARRFATGGGLVICDRFPLHDLMSMDGPRVANSLGGRSGRLAGFLTALERRYSEKLAPPDLLIVLLVDPEVAVQRRSDEAADLVRRRCEELRQVDWGSTPAHVIDASRPLPEVLAAVKRLVWSEL